ncbi:alpha/beta hydrolase [Thermodesulfobacteriota bacterium]
MIHEDSFFKGSDNHNIFFQKWSSEGQPKAVILIAHGYAEHSGRYMNVVNHFIPSGYQVYALDHRGHGKSDGKLDDISDFSIFVADLRKFFNIIREEYPEGEIFLIGHSMGSVISLLFALDYQQELAGLAISGCGLSKADDPPLPQRPADQPLDSSFLSRDPEVITDYENDPLVYRGPIPQTIESGMVKGLNQVSMEVEKIELPVIIMAGDGCMDGARSQTLYDSIGSKDRTLKRYPDLMHEIFNEPEHPLVMADLAVWIEEHM